jgi:hypothetical protein
MNKSLFVCALLTFSAFCQQEETDQGPDTGNWYEKLHWWREARQLYAIDIREAMEELKTIEQEYEGVRKAITEQISNAYASLPVNRTAAGPLIKSLLEDSGGKIAKAEEEGAQSTKQQTAEEKKELAQLQEQHTLLEKLTKDFDLQNTLADRLDEALNKVYPRQVALAHEYDEQALKNFENIEQVYDDKKAHGYYNVVENSLENIQANNAYLAGPLKSYVEQIKNRFAQGMPQLTKTIKALEDLGVEIRILTPEQKAQKEALLKKQEEDRLKAAAERKAAQDREKMSWWQKLIAGIKNFFSWLWSSVSGLFTSSAPATKPVARPQKPVSALPMPDLPKLKLPGSTA